MGDEITEMEVFDAERLDVVPEGANGFPFLVMKSVSEGDEPVAKADDEMAEGEAPIPEVPVVEVTVETSGDEPGSPAWEAEDAANLTAAAQSLVVVAQRIKAASDREGVEGEWRSAWRLEDAQCAVEAALGIVAALSYVEAAEGAVAKSVDADTAEFLGRTQTTIAELLGNDLSEEDIVEKSKIEAIVDEKLAAYQLATTGQLVEKAADEIVDETATKAEGETPADETVTEPAEKADGETPDEPVEAATKAADEPVEPAAETAATTDEPEAATKAPAEPVAEQTPDMTEVLKGALSEAVKDAMAPFGDALKSIEDRIEKVESQPAPGGPFLNGSPLAAAVLRGVPESTDSDAAMKAIEGIADPALRESVLRDVAIQQMKGVYGG